MPGHVTHGTAYSAGPPHLILISLFFPVLCDESGPGLVKRAMQLLVFQIKPEASNSKKMLGFKTQRLMPEL